MVDIALKLILLFSPISYTVGISLHKFNLIFFHLSAVLLLAASFFDKPKRHKSAPLLGIFTVLLVCHAFWHDFHPVVLNGIVNIFLALCMVKIIAIYASQSDDWGKYMVWAGIINILVLSGQMAGFSPIISMEHTEFGGIMGNAPILGTYLAITLPFALSVSPWAFVLYVIAGVAMKELSILACAFVCLFFYIGKNKYRDVIYFILFCIVFWFSPEIIQSLKMRWVIWGPTIEQIFNRPAFGHGVGMFQHVSDQFIKIPVSTTQNYHAENSFSSFIQLTFAFGSTGVIFGLFVLKYIKDHFKGDKEETALVCLLILCVFEYPMQIPRLWLTIISIISIYLIRKGVMRHGKTSQ